MAYNISSIIQNHHFSSRHSFHLISNIAIKFSFCSFQPVASRFHLLVACTLLQSN